MKFLCDKLTKGQKLTLIVLFLPASLFLLGVIYPHGDTGAVFWVYVSFLVCAYLILSLIFRNFFEKHINKISHLAIVLFFILNIAVLGEISIEGNWHWEPKKPDILGDENSFYDPYEYIDFCESDFNTLKERASSKDQNLYTYESGLILITKNEIEDLKKYDPNSIQCFMPPDMYKTVNAFYLDIEKPSQETGRDLFAKLGIEPPPPEKHINRQEEIEKYKQQLELLTAWYSWKKERKKINDLPKIEFDENPFDEDYFVLWLFTVFFIGLVYFNLFSKNRFL